MLNQRPSRERLRQARLPRPSLRPAASQIVPMASALIASLSMGEKISGGGAIAAVISFFLPWVSIAILGTSANGFDLGKTDGATYLILLLAIAAGALCYLSSKAAASRRN